jgi:purine-binding chemotaxis protein CheW
MNAVTQLGNKLAVASGTMARAQAAQEQTQYLTFRVGSELFGIGITAIKEIIEYHSLTVVPLMPECIRGVINLRGAVVPAMDLSVRFGRKPTEITKRTCVVIVEIAGDGTHQDVGVIVDAVNQVLDIPASDIEPPPAFGAKLRTDFIHGMGKVSGKFVILLDVDHVLSFDEIAQLAEVTASESAALPAAPVATTIEPIVQGEQPSKARA